MLTEFGLLPGDNLIDLRRAPKSQPHIGIARVCAKRLRATRSNKGMSHVCGRIVVRSGS